MKKLLFIAFLFSVATLNAQEYKSFTIENISEEAVWPAVIQAFRDVKLPRPSVNKYTGTGETKYYYYKALMIKNRLRFEVEYSEGALTVGILGRQYESEQGWADNLLPMSKKKAKKLLDPLQKRIRELTKDKPYHVSAIVASHSVKPSTQSKSTTNSPTANKTGIYDDFVIMRTNDPDMDLLAVHENGNIIGFDLWDDKMIVKSLVFKDNPEGKAVLVTFDKNGAPTGILTETHIVKVTTDDYGYAELAIRDLQGVHIGTKKVSLPDFKKSLAIPDENIQRHGPAPSISIGVEEESSFSTYVANASTVSKFLLCTGGVATAASGAGAVLAGVACSSLFFDLIASELPKDHPKYDQMYWASEITGMVSLKDPKGWIKIVGNINSALGIPNYINDLGMIYDFYCDLEEEYWAPPKLEIIGDRDDIEAGIFGERGEQPLIFHIKTNNPEYNIEIVAGGDELEIEKYDLTQNDFIDKTNLDEKEKIYCEVYAKESAVSRHWIYAEQIIDGEPVSASKEIMITQPTKYYYLPNCSDCSDAPSQKLQCEEKLNQCLNSLKKDENNIYFVLDADDNIIDCNKTLNDARRDYVRSSASTNRGFKSFVKEAPCSFSCEGLADRETIISLAHEAMDKIQAINDKIEALQKVVNEDNYLKIGMEIKKLEDRIKPIRKEYGERINAIAEKGTIRFETIHKDPARYYEPSGTMVVGAHWSRPFLTILLKMETTAQPYLETLYEDTPSPITLEYKDVSTVTCLYMGKDNEELMKGTFFARHSSGLDFSTFEKLEKIHTIKSNPISVRVDK